MKRKFLFGGLAFLLSGLLIVSAFAVQPSHVSVIMPDPYGVSTLALADDGGTYSFNGTILYGAYPSAYRTSLTDFSSSFSTSFSGFARTYYYSGSPVSDTYSYGSYLSVTSGSYIDVLYSVSLSTSDYDAVLFSGGLSSVFLYSSGGGVSSKVYGSSFQLIMNDSLIGDVYSLDSSGSGSVPSLEVSMTSDVYNIGYRIFISGSDSQAGSSSMKSSGSDLRFSVSDNLLYTPIEAVQEDPYIPLMEEQISWLQAIFSAVNPLYSAIQNLASLMGQSGEGVNRIASVFARDDDIQLRDDVDDTIKTATDSFFSESNSTTQVNSEKVTQAKDSLEGASAMFGASGYSVDSFFNDASSSSDDYLAWFSSDTASWLDSTGSGASLEDDDPYNMQLYYDRIGQIAGLRGGGSQ